MAQDHPTVKVGFSVTNHYSERIRPQGRELLSAYLESLEKSCKYPFEVFIVDNESEDRLDENKLPDHYKTVIILRDIEQLSYEDISKIVGVPLGTIKSRINRARLQIQAEIQDYK